LIEIKIRTMTNDIANIQIMNTADHKEHPAKGDYRVSFDGKVFMIHNHKRSLGVYPLLKRVFDHIAGEK